MSLYSEMFRLGNIKRSSDLSVISYDDVNAVKVVLVLEIHLQLHLLPAWHPRCFAGMRYTHFLLALISYYHQESVILDFDELM